MTCINNHVRYELEIIVFYTNILSQEHNLSFFLWGTSPNVFKKKNRNVWKCLHSQNIKFIKSKGTTASQLAYSTTRQIYSHISIPRIHMETLSQQVYVWPRKAQHAKLSLTPIAGHEELCCASSKRPAYGSCAPRLNKNLEAN